MKALIAVGLLVACALPASAFERMMRSDCRAAIAQVSALMGDAPAKTATLREATRVTPQGWCEIRGAAVDSAEFDTFIWRAEGIARWTRDGIPPLALEFNITGLDPDGMQNSANTSRPPVNISATLRQIPDAGQVIVERAVMENGAGDSLSFTGAFERMFLSSPSMMQVSLGAAAFKAGLVTVTLGGRYENPFGFKASFDLRGTPQSQRGAAFEVLSNLPDGLINDQSRAELTAFAGDLPKPVGTLEVHVNSERGLGIMQVGVAAAMSMTALTQSSDQMEILFDGLSIDANWTPTAHVAD